MKTLKQIYKSITKSEWKLCCLLGLIIIFITTFPIVYGYLVAPTGQALSGIRALTPIDMNVYYSYIEQVKQGKYIFYNLFTNETQSIPLIFNIFWLTVGLMSKVLNLNSIIAFQLSRIILIPIFIFVIYIFISYFFENRNKRKTALFIILFSSGVGAFLIPVLQNIAYKSYGYYHWPLDLWVAESITFLTLFHMPHFIASLILIILIFLFIILSWQPESETKDFFFTKNKYEIYAGICALFLFQFHPFHLLTVFGVLGGYFVFWSVINKKILWSKLKPLIILFIFTIPNLIYHFYILTDPIIKQRALQNVCLTPVWWLTLIGFGFLTPFALIGVCHIYKNKKSNPSTNFNKYHFLAVWLVIQTIIIYSPNPLQRRMSEGLHIVLSLLTVIGLYALLEFAQKNIKLNLQKQINLTKMPSSFFKKKLELISRRLNKIILYLNQNKTLLFVLFAVFFVFSNFYNIARDVLMYKDQSIIFYLPIEKQDAFDWIKNNTNPNSIFFAHQTTANHIAGKTARFVYSGHSTESLFYHAKNKKIEWFFSNNTVDNKKIEFLKQNNINYVYYSDWEQVYNKKDQGFNPDQKDYLELVYENGVVKIYGVKNYK